MNRRTITIFSALLLSLCACTPGAAPVATASAPLSAAAESAWPFEVSDIPVDPAYRFGRLENGMRYVIRQNATPEGTAVVRMAIDSGSLSESEAELGYAHFVEHMAFNGSTNVPEGEMVRLLEREGLAFGADTNASTGFEETVYKLDLPRNDPALLDTALMLMRETAGELTFDDDAVDRERGVVISEMRDRDTYTLREVEDRLVFLNPEARYPRRLPIGEPETLARATGESLRALWQREYVPANATLVVVGDFPKELVEARIRERFADWAARPLPPEPGAGPVETDRSGETDIYLDPALSERITASRHGRWLDEPDTVAQRLTDLLRQIGYAIVNRRLQRLSRLEDAPFRDAGFGTGDVFEAGRTTNLIVDTGDGEWRRGLTAAVREYRRALQFGFSEHEIAEQIANIRNQAEVAAASADTRRHEELAGAALRLVQDEIVPSTPQSALKRLEAFIPQITPDAVLQAMTEDAVPLDDPLLRFRGRQAPEGGADAIRQAWDEAFTSKLDPNQEAQLTPFAYTDFGPPGAIVEDHVNPRLDIREIRFANNVRLNLKPTALEQDRIRIELNLDGGDMLDTRDNPLATEMVASLPRGGLGAHSEDELQSLFAGRNVSFVIRPDEETFRITAQTTPNDLEVQLQLIAATLSDPGFRPEGEESYRRLISNYFARKDATPASALAAALDGILSDGDPRFTLQDEADYRALTYAKLREDIGDRLSGGAIELALVGDFDPDEAISLVARTLGALPEREPAFRDYAQNRTRPFTADRSVRIIRHDGQPNQAIVHLVWPTRDDSDPAESMRLELLERVVSIALTDTLREALGATYSPRARSSLSRYYEDYGTFEIRASVDPEAVEGTRAAISETLEMLASQPVDADTLQRARQPMLETLDNALKSNSGWMAVVDRAQSESQRIDRFLSAKERLEAIGGADLQATAQQYLAPERAVTVLVLPRPAAPL